MARKFSRLPTGVRSLIFVHLPSDVVERRYDDMTRRTSLCVLLIAMIEIPLQERRLLAFRSCPSFAGIQAQGGSRAVLKPHVASCRYRKAGVVKLLFASSKVHMSSQMIVVFHQNRGKPGYLTGIEAQIFRVTSMPTR